MSGIKEQLIAHKTAAAVIAAVFLLSVTAIIYMLRQPGSSAANPSAVSPLSSNLNVTVNEIGRTQKKSSGSSDAEIAQAVLLSSSTEQQQPYVPKTSSPADDHKRPASSASTKNARPIINPVQSIEAPDAVAITVGTSEGINIKVLPVDAVDKAVSWSSDDPEIASVDKTGMVTGNRTGSCRITACSCEKSKVKAVICITVKAGND